MPERSFGRTVRYRRTKLGLSQAQLGELVGRSASSIRSWERDDSTPTDASVLFALAAILDLDEEALFEKSGVEMPPQETHPSVDEALASLAPLPVDAPIDETEEEVGPASGRETVTFSDPVPPTTEDEDEPELDTDSELEAEVREHLEAAADPEREPDPVFEPFSIRTEPIEAAAMRSNLEPAFVSPPEPFVITAPTPPVVEPSYMEDDEQRQLYRVRSLATIVLFVGLVIVLLWSLSNTIDALGAWWDEFFGTLRL
jgi:transcriptional regulator with XRE-family HTH domain